MLAMFDCPRLSLMLQGLAEPGGLTLHKLKVFGVSVDRSGAQELSIQIYASSDAEALIAEVVTWVDRVQALIGVRLERRPNSAQPRLLVWKAASLEDLDRFVEAWVLSDVGINSGGAVRLLRNDSGLCVPAAPRQPYTVEFSLSWGHLYVSVPPVYSGHDDSPKDPAQADWLAGQIAVAGVRASRDPQATSQWELATAEDHNRLYRYLTSGQTL